MTEMRRIWWCETEQRAVVILDPARVLDYDVCSASRPYCHNCGWFWLVPAPIPDELLLAALSDP